VRRHLLEHAQDIYREAFNPNGGAQLREESRIASSGRQSGVAMEEPEANASLAPDALISPAFAHGGSVDGIWEPAGPFSPPEQAISSGSTGGRAACGQGVDRRYCWTDRKSVV
jgi:hypothetical protein